MTFPDRLDILAVLCVSVVTQLDAQTTRDSAGIHIVESARAVRAGQPLLLSRTPSLVIGMRPESVYQFSRVAQVVRLSNGVIVVPDGGSRQLRFFDSTGAFVRSVGLPAGSGRGSQAGLSYLARLPGDTLAAGSEVGDLAYFTGDGSLIRQLSIRSPVIAPMPIFPALAAALVGGKRVVSLIRNPQLRAPGVRWVDSLPLVIVDDRNVITSQLGTHAMMELGMDGQSPSQVWFGPVVSFATSGSSFFFGFPTEYSIRQYDADGRLRRIIRRAWTPVRVTPADIADYVVEWGKRWITTTGAAADSEYADLRDDPYAPTVPAFSQLIVDRGGGLWVREPHVQDAALAGELYHMPLVPSRWSVFDAEGLWRADVTMPANFLPTDIGIGYVLGRARTEGGPVTVVMYRLGPM